jgi:hypothetical protein
VFFFPLWVQRGEKTHHDVTPAPTKITGVGCGTGAAAGI